MDVHVILIIEHNVSWFYIKTNLCVFIIKSINVIILTRHVKVKNRAILCWMCRWNTKASTVMQGFAIGMFGTWRGVYANYRIFSITTFYLILCGSGLVDHHPYSPDLTAIAITDLYAAEFSRWNSTNFAGVSSLLWPWFSPPASAK